MVYSVASNDLEGLYNSMPKRIADLIKAKGDATKYWRTMLLCFIGIYLKYVVEFFQ